MARDLPVKISMVIGTLERGGAEHQMARLALELVARGHDVEVITLHGWGPLQPRLEAGGVPVLGLAPPDRRWRIRKVHGAIDLASPAARLTAHWRAWRPDVVHAWLPEAQVLSLPIAQQLRVPVRVLALRSMRSGPRKSAILDGLLRLAGAAATHITANSTAVARDSGWKLGSRSRVVIPNGIDIPPISASVSDDPPRGVVVANLLPYKGHRDLIEALALAPSRPHMTFVGEGPERHGLEELARARGLDRQIEFAGSVPDVARILTRSQFAVLPSHTEGLPNAVLEAMSLGLPTVSTRVGGVPDLIEDEVNGLLVPVGDRARLAGAIDRIVDDVDLRTRLGYEARSRASGYSWDRVAGGYLRLYVDQ